MPVEFPTVIVCKSADRQYCFPCNDRCGCAFARVAGAATAKVDSDDAAIDARVHAAVMLMAGGNAAVAKECERILERCRSLTSNRCASLSSRAQAHLQAALAKHWAYRDLSRYDELQRAFGQRITAVVPLSAGKKMRVGFTLEDGTQLVFDASDELLPPPKARATTTFTTPSDCNSRP